MSNFAKYLVIFSVWTLTSCSFQTYTPKPIQPEVVAQNFESKTLLDPNFQTFLRNKNYPKLELPVQTWDLNTLIDCALFFHPSLNLARAQWKAAQASQNLASQKPLPTVNANVARSNTANQDINPFAYTFSIDIPINDHNKREIQIERFTHLSNIAKLEVAQTAWQLRYGVAQSLIDLEWHATQLTIQAKEVALKQEIVAMIEKRVQLGVASNLELSQAYLQLQSSKTQQQALQQNKLGLTATFANHLGLPLTVVSEMHLNFDAPAKPFENELAPSLDIQKSALLNRLDMRIALERYAVAEQKLKLEIAKQYPDIVISPGYAYEFGDKVWSLGISSLLSILKKNKAAIAEAEQFREVEVAQFEVLQANIISEANLANASYHQTLQLFNNQQLILTQQQQNLAKLTAQFSAGEIDRLTLALAKLALLVSEKEVALSRYQLNAATLNLENTLQTPLLNSKHISSNTDSAEQG